MNTQQDSALAHSLKDQNVHPIPAGTQPGTADATVRPLPGPDGYYMAVPSNPLERTSEQKLADFNREYERAVTFYYAACDAENAAAEGRERAEVTVKHAERILEDIERSAYAVPTRTVREVALKARILSYAKREFWDNAQDNENADVRFVIEDILALGGLGRMRGREFAFNDLLPNYDGPALYDPASASTEPVKSTPNSSIHELGLEVQSLWDLDTRVENRAMWDKTMPSVLESNRRQIADRISAIEAQITYTQPATLADLMVQLALIHDNVDAMGREHSKLDEAITRMVASALVMLSNMTGLSLKDAGVEAYAKNLVAFGSMPLAERLDPDRFDRDRARWREEDAARRTQAEERAA